MGGEFDAAPCRKTSIWKLSLIVKTSLFIFLLWGSLALAGTPISFQQFPAGDSIHVQFASRGCFHDQMFEFNFQRAARVTAKVTEVER